MVIKMIKKLRIKFIASSMASLFIVLCVILGAVNILNYREIVADADFTLSLLAKNNGVFDKDFDIDDFDDYLDDDFDNDFDDLDDDDFEIESKNPLPNKDKKRKPQISPELPYESRYFSVSLNNNSNVISANTGRIAAVNTATAVEYAQAVQKSGKERGFIKNYRYKADYSDDETRIVFLDCGRNLDTFRTFALTCIIVSAISLAAVLLLMIFLSGRIVKPFSENYEKQKRFITDAGHELKTPLTIIDADAEVLEMDFGQNEWLSDIKNQTKRLSDMTNSLIILSKTEEENNKVQMIEFPLTDIAEETAESFMTLIKSQDKTIDLNIQPLVSMCGDEKAIRQLLTILLDNAVKYSQPGGKISLTLEKQKKFIRLSVSNTTDFISKEHLEHLFDRFYRTDKSRNSQTGGYGLGLSIASSIVQAHKGKITASTEDEKSLLITSVFPAV